MKDVFFEHAVPVVAFVSFWGVVAVLASMVG